MALLPAAPRLTRSESMAQTRSRLLEAAWSVFIDAGYEQATVERISEVAGFTRGAFYKHFPSKAAIYLETVSHQANRMAPGMLATIESSRSPEHALEIVVEWARSRVFGKELGFLLIEVLQHAQRTGERADEMLAPIRGIWGELGSRLRRFMPANGLSLTDEELGAFVIELAHAPIVEGAGGPGSHRLVEIGLRALFRVYH